MSEEVQEQIFQVGAPARLILNNIRGSIVIRPQGPDSQENAILVKAVKDLESGDGEQTTIEMKQEEDGLVTVRTLFAGQGLRGFQKIAQKPCLIDYTIQLPTNCSIKVETISSSIDIEKLEGEFEINSVSGAAVFQDLSGWISCQCVSGQIRGERLNGKILCENVSGDILLTQSQIPALEAKTVSGEIVVDASGQADAYRFHTISGGLTLILAAGQGISVHMQSLSGKLYMHHADGVASQKAPHDLAVQGGGPQIRFNTVSGDLHLTTPDLYEAETVGEQDEKAPNQHDVLESVARGEMSAEEGLNALKGSASG